MHHRLRYLFSFEFLFALFLFAGVFKSNSVIQSLAPVDATAVLLGVSAVAAARALASQGGSAVHVRAAAVLIGLYAAFVGFALLSILWSGSSEYVFGKALRLLTVTAWSLVGGAFVVSSSPARLRRFSAAVIVLAAALAVETFRIALFGDLWATRPFDSSSYLLPGRLLGMALVCVLFFISRARTRGAFLFWLSLLASFALALLLIGARGPFLAAAVAGGCFLGARVWIRSDWPVFRLPIWVAFTGVGALAGAVAAWVAVLLGFRAYTVQRLGYLLDGGGFSARNRLRLYRDAVDQFAASPLVGGGLGSYPIDAPARNQQLYPHNLLLEIAAELGLVGLLLFAALAAVALSWWWHLRPTPEATFVSALLCYWLLNAFVTGDVNSNRYVFLSLGLLLVDDSANSRETRGAGDAGGRRRERPGEVG